MNKRSFSFILIFFLITIVGCTSPKTVEPKTVEYEGTVLSKDNTSILFVEKYIEIEQEISLAQAFEEYGRDNVIKFVGLSESKVKKIKIGDKVIVHAVGDFDDGEPITGGAEDVEVVE